MIELSLAGLPIPQLVQSFCVSFTVFASLAGLPIPQLVQWVRWGSCRQFRLAGLPIPQLVQCPNQNTPCEQGVFWFGLK